MAAIAADDPRQYRHGETVVLGLDPSMTETGYGVLKGDRLLGAGKIETHAGDPEPARLWVIFSEITAVIREFGVQHVAVEQFRHFYRAKPKATGTGMLAPLALGARGGEPVRRGKHDREAVDPMAMFLMKGAQTAAQMAALASRCPLFLYPVAEWKGGQRVGKEEILQRACQLYGLTTRNHNITDAIMIGRHHIMRGRFQPERGVLIEAP